jgi:predicted amidohydrolase YtcJ
VTRRSQEGNVIGFAERLSPYAALQMCTRGGAWMGFAEDQKGTIAPGMYADLIVLDADPTMVSPEEIGQIKVKMTILNGEVVWSDSRC